MRNKMLIAKRVSTTVKPRPKKQEVAFLNPVCLKTDYASSFTFLPYSRHSFIHSFIQLIFIDHLL